MFYTGKEDFAMNFLSDYDFCMGKTGEIALGSAKNLHYWFDHE